MKTFKDVSLAKKVSVMFALLFGLALVSVPKAFADDNNNRYVNIGGTRYDVRNNDSGPYIRVMGDKFYLSSDSNDKTVIVDGVSYNVHTRKDGDGDSDGD